MTLFAAVALWFVSLVVLLGVSIIACGFRDGVLRGPDIIIIESQGALALSRFWVGLRGPLLLFVLPGFVAGSFLFWRWYRSTV